MTKTLTMATLFTLKRTARCTLVAFVALAALPPAPIPGRATANA